MQELAYMTGFGNEFASEALKGALPMGQNSPQRLAYDLYAEQLNGSAFTAPQGKNLRSWLYKLQPSVVHGEFSPYEHRQLLCPPFTNDFIPDQLRFGPHPIPTAPTHFIDGWFTQAGHGSPNQQIGAAIHLYACNRDMVDTYFCNADGELLIVPEIGGLVFKTEFGTLSIQPGEIMVLPRGVKCQVMLTNEQARGYICENYGQCFQLPERGPIGANGLANPRDFYYPNACFEEKSGNFSLLQKFAGKLWQANLQHSPLDVVAWHGNLAPYKYNLDDFCTMNTVSFDHPDPSIFTVLTASSGQVGVANIDFVIFPSRWMVAEHSFRPPYFHRNIMSEYMGLIRGDYDAKPGAFVPGGSSLHNCMIPHGPSTSAFEHAINQELVPEKYADTLAFMFESCYPWQATQQALESDTRDHQYLVGWQGLKKQFSGKK